MLVDHAILVDHAMIDDVILVDPGKIMQSLYFTIWMLANILNEMFCYRISLLNGGTMMKANMRFFNQTESQTHGKPGQASEFTPVFNHSKTGQTEQDSNQTHQDEEKKPCLHEIN